MWLFPGHSCRYRRHGIVLRRHRCQYRPSQFTLAGLGWTALRAINGEELWGWEVLGSRLCTVIYFSGAETWLLLSATRGASVIAAGPMGQHTARLANCAAVPGGLKNKLINISG